MNRPMAVIGFSLFFTLIAVGLLGYTVAFWAFIGLAGLFFISAIIFRRRLPTRFLAVTVSVMIACAFFCTYTKFVYNRVLNYAGSELAVKFEITDIQGEENGTYYYTAKVTGTEYKGLNGAKIAISSSTALEVEVCDFVRASVTFDIAGSNMRSSHLYYKSSGIFLRTHIIDGYEIEKNPDKSLGFYFCEIKQAISQLISANLNEDSAGVVKSIFLGDTSSLDYKESMNFRNVGISHIFCVSGLHVTLVSMLSYKFLSALIERKYVLYSVTVLIVWLFVAVTGFSYSSIRSGIMLSVYYIGCMIGRDADSLNSLGFAALVLCLLNPFSATNISLLYSFFATLGILVMPKPKLARVKSKLIRPIIETALMSVNVMVFTLPIQIFFFGTATLISPVANCLIFFVIAPLMSCVIIAVILSLFTSILSSLFFLVCAVIAKYLVWISDVVTAVPFATVDANMDFVKLLVVIICFIFLAIAYLRLGKRSKIFAATVCATMIFVSVACYNIFFRPVMTAAVIDSGSATSVVVTCGRKTVVVGCGGRNYTASEVSYTLRQGSINKIDLLILPSMDKTEAFNIDGLADMIDIKTVISGEDYGLLYSLGLDDFSVSREGKCTVGDMTVSYSYTDESRLTHIEMGENSLLVVSRISAECEIDGKWRSADIVISVGAYYSTNNEKINVLCTDKNGDYPVTEVCYKDGGNIVIDFLKNGKLNCERRA